jgi:nucleoid DNA-binding protein
MSREQEDLIRKLSYKYNLPLKTIKEICSAPTEFVASKMREGDETEVFISHFGRFGVNKMRKQYVENARLKNETQTNNNTSRTGNSK